MDVKPIVRKSITEQVFEQLKDQLLSGVWKTGEKLPSETDLAKLFTVSRVTIRQALQRLAVSGLVETRTGEGSFVKEINLGIYMNSMIPVVKLNHRMMLEVLEFRQLVEVRTAGICALRSKESDIERLKEIYERMKAFENDNESFSDADLDFHIEIANITKNSLIIETYKIIYNILKVAIIDIVKKRGSEKGLYFHSKLLNAIESGNSQAAMDVMENHLLDTYDSIMKEEQSGAKTINR